jgi:hypothetical protein
VGWLCGGLVDELMSLPAREKLVQCWFLGWLAWLAGWTELDDTMMSL